MSNNGRRTNAPTKERQKTGSMKSQKAFSLKDSLKESVQEHALQLQALVPTNLTERLMPKKNRAVRVPPKEPFRHDKTVTSLQIQQHQNTTAETLSKLNTTDLAQVAGEARSRKKESEDRKPALLLILAAAVLLIGLAWSGLRSASSGAGNLGANKGVERESREFRERVEFHRSTVGSRINRQRIDVELKNHHVAPKLRFDTQKVAAPDVMNGLPLDGEKHHRSDSRAQTQPLNPNYPDARIMYGLQEEQDMQQWEKRAQREYVDEFIANAAREGIRVKVDKGGNVKIDNRPIPVWERPGYDPDQEGPRDPSSVR